MNELDRRDGVDAKGHGDGRIQYTMVPHAIGSARANQDEASDDLQTHRDLKQGMTAAYVDESFIQAKFKDMVSKGAYTLKS